MRGSRPFTVIFGGLFPLIGVVLLVLGYAIYRSHERALESGILTTGTVVGLEESYDAEGSMHAPIVRFTTRDGMVVEFTSATRSRPAGYGPGDSVDVLYQPGDPGAAEIDSAFDRYGATVILSVVGVFLGLGGALAAVVVNRFLFDKSEAREWN